MKRIALPKRFRVDLTATFQDGQVVSARGFGYGATLGAFMDDGFDSIEDWDGDAALLDSISYGDKTDKLDLKGFSLAVKEVA